MTFRLAILGRIFLCLLLVELSYDGLEGLKSSIYFMDSKKLLVPKEFEQPHSNQGQVMTEEKKIHSSSSAGVRKITRKMNSNITWTK
jgi:glycine cleavage system regulatory protein